ncbi:MAG: TauD/TfdA family dioxygenase, partial [Burkholderiaceae bacterium]|nr:TauD/TfdA family dioxygenase [Burkholderiaceae bacterium]
SNIKENGKPIGLEDAGRMWHSDMCFTANPPQGSLLYALEVPMKDGQPLGDTLFASTAAAYDALPQALREKIADLQVVNSFAHYAQIKREARQTQGAERSEVKAEPPPDVIHPMVRVHPRTGRKCLYLSDGISHKVVGMSDAEGARLIADLLAHMTREEFVYRHRWAVGDLVVWDNCSAIHLAQGGYAPLRRRMHRTTIAAAAQ